MRKILVLGASGMAGHIVSTYLRENDFDVDTLSSRNQLDKSTLLVDVMNLSELKKVLESTKYDVIVNCIGMLVKESESRQDLASFLNGFLPHYLENFYKDSSTKLIHLSTDCVFSGNNPPYKEDSPYDGDLFYDRSKALGELKNTKDLTFRMSIIGPDMQEKGTGLFNWFYAQSGEISGYTKAMWTGVTTLELAKAMKAAIDQDLSGLYHLVNGGNISKFDLLRLFKEVFARNDISVSENDNVILDKSLINTRTDFDHQVPGYKDMVQEMKEWIVNHPDLYKHYEGVS